MQVLPQATYVCPIAFPSMEPCHPDSQETPPLLIIPWLLPSDWVPRCGLLQGRDHTARLQSPHLSARTHSPKGSRPPRMRGAGPCRLERQQVKGGPQDLEQL